MAFTLFLVFKIGVTPFFNNLIVIVYAASFGNAILYIHYKVENTTTTTTTTNNNNNNNTKMK